MKKSDTPSTDPAAVKQPTSEPFVARVSPHLTPSEIESLRKHRMQASTSLRGRFADLFKK